MSSTRSCSSAVAFRGALACTLFATVIGCSGRPKNVAKKVTGTVTVGGKPLADAAIAFTPTTTGSASFSGTDAEGKYNLVWGNVRGKPIEGAQIGEHTVMISTFRQGNPDGKPPKPDTPEKVPYKYRQGTGLPKATVKAGVNTIDFALEDGPVDPPAPTKGKKGKAK